MRVCAAVCVRGHRMFKNVKWLFLDVGSTLLDESIAYGHRFQDLAVRANLPYETVYETALAFYKENKKGDKETAKQLGVPLSKWYSEDEMLYPDAEKCLKALHSRYKIGIIANQEPGTKERLARHGILSYIDLVVASAEEGVAKPDHRIFGIALERSGCAPQEAIMIGDRIDNDILPAKEMGMRTIWIKQGFGQYWMITRETEQPDSTVNSLTELCTLL